MQRSKVGSIDLQFLLSADAKRSDEAQALADWLAEQDKSLPKMAGSSIQEARIIRALQSARTNADLPSIANIERISIPGLGNTHSITCDLIEPENALPGCIAYFHGGGWAFGDLNSHARLARVLAETTKSRVLYVDYRLAPEHIYPAAHDDAVAAWRWIVEQSHIRLDFQGPLVIAGDSAGANLAIGCLLRELDSGRPIPQAALLFYGVLSDDTNSPSYLRFSNGYGLTREGMAKFWDLYVPDDGQSPSRRDEFCVCPVKAPDEILAQLPPIFMNAAGLDPLLCDTLEFAALIEAAGGDFELHVHEGVQHAFMQQTARLAEARRAFSLVGDFYSRRLR
jgi:acetyl esterase